MHSLRNLPSGLSRVLSFSDSTRVSHVFEVFQTIDHHSILTRELAWIVCSKGRVKIV